MTRHAEPQQCLPNRHKAVGFGVNSYALSQKAGASVMSESRP